MSIKRALTRYEPVPAGTYFGNIVDIVEDDSGEYGPKIKWIFGLDHPEHGERTLIGWCSDTYSTKSKLLEWTCAALNGPAPEEFDSDALIGKPVRLLVTEETGKNGDTFNKIAKVLPARVATTKAARPVPSTPAAPKTAPAPEFPDDWDANLEPDPAEESIAS